MNERLERFLHTDPGDPGCAETLRLLHVYAELILAGEDPEERHPRGSPRTCARASRAPRISTGCWQCCKS